MPDAHSTTISLGAASPCISSPTLAKRPRQAAPAKQDRAVADRIDPQVALLAQPHAQYIVEQYCDLSRKQNELSQPIADMCSPPQAGRGCQLAIKDLMRKGQSCMMQ